MFHRFFADEENWRPQWVTFMFVPDSTEIEDNVTLTHLRFLCLLAETLITDITGSYVQKEHSQQNWWGTCTHLAINEPLKLALSEETPVLSKRCRRRSVLQGRRLGARIGPPLPIAGSSSA